MYIGERRKHQLQKEGVCVKMIESKTMQIINQLKEEGYTLLEGKILATELSCALAEAEKYSSGTKLLEINFQSLH